MKYNPMHMHIMRLILCLAAVIPLLAHDHSWKEKPACKGDGKGLTERKGKLFRQRNLT